MSWHGPLHHGNAEWQDLICNVFCMELKQEHKSKVLEGQETGTSPILDQATATTVITLNINSRKETASSSFKKCKILFFGSVTYNRELISCQSKLLWEQPLEREGCEQAKGKWRSITIWLLHQRARSLKQCSVLLCSTEPA